jgi:hypothetical protein
MGYASGFGSWSRQWRSGYPNVQNFAFSPGKPGTTFDKGKLTALRKVAKSPVFLTLDGTLMGNRQTCFVSPKTHGNALFWESQFQERVFGDQ